MKSILWLSSWYPNVKAPFAGDFIQRHAIAVSFYIPVTVIHVTQYGEEQEMYEDDVVVRENGNFREIIVYFKFKKTGFSYLNKWRYNRKFFSVYKKLIRDYFKANELPSLIHLHVPMKAGIMALWIKRQFKIPYIVSEHASSYWPGATDEFGKRSFYHKAAVKKIFQQADMVTNVSYTVGELIRNLFNIRDVKVIPNVVNTDYFHYLPAKPEMFRFIHVSILNEQKNPLGMLHAFNAMSKTRNDWELVLVGPIAEDLIQAINELKLEDRISFTGEIQYPEVASQMQKSSAFVLFSKHENLPCVVLEALCCGLPVIATDVGGVRDVIKKENGILIECGNEDQLFAALNKMIDTYSIFNRSEIAKNAQNKFNYQTVGKQFIYLYDSLLKNNMRHHVND